MKSEIILSIFGSFLMIIPNVFAGVCGGSASFDNSSIIYLTNPYANYPVLLALNSSYYSVSDCSDVRIYPSDNSTALPLWIENKTSNICYIWFKTTDTNDPFLCFQNNTAVSNVTNYEAVIDAYSFTNYPTLANGNKKATTTSEWGAPYIANHTIDNLVNSTPTAFENIWICADSPTFPVNLSIDLNGTYKINKIMIMQTVTGGTNYKSGAYDLFASGSDSGSDYTNANEIFGSGTLTQDSGLKINNTNATKQVRYIKYNIKGTASGGSGCGAEEVWAWGFNLKTPDTTYILGKTSGQSGGTTPPSISYNIMFNWLENKIGLWRIDIK